jgi:hypothetical protein
MYAVQLLYDGAKIIFIFYRQVLKGLILSVCGSFKVIGILQDVLSVIPFRVAGIQLGCFVIHHCLLVYFIPLLSGDLLRCCRRWQCKINYYSLVFVTVFSVLTS